MEIYCVGRRTAQMRGVGPEHLATPDPTICRICSPSLSRKVTFSARFEPCWPRILVPPPPPRATGSTSQHAWREIRSPRRYLYQARLDSLVRVACFTRTTRLLEMRRRWSLSRQVLDSSRHSHCMRCALIIASMRKSKAGGDRVQVVARHCLLALPPTTSETCG